MDDTHPTRRERRGRAAEFGALAMAGTTLGIFAKRLPILVALSALALAPLFLWLHGEMRAITRDSAELKQLLTKRDGDALTAEEVQQALRNFRVASPLSERVRQRKRRIERTPLDGAPFRIALTFVLMGLVAPVVLRVLGTRGRSPRAEVVRGARGLPLVLGAALVAVVAGGLTTWVTLWLSQSQFPFALVVGPAAVFALLGVTLLVPIASDERLGPFSAVERSGKLLAGSRWTILLSLVFLACVEYAAVALTNATFLHPRQLTELGTWTVWVWVRFGLMVLFSGIWAVHGSVMLHYLRTRPARTKRAAIERVFS